MNLTNPPYAITKSTLEQMIADDEGYRAQIYRCSAGKLTIGYGTNLSAGLSEDEALVLNKTQISADGIDTAIATDLPIPFMVDIDGEEYEIDDGTLEFCHTVPGTYLITPKTFPYQSTPVEVVVKTREIEQRIESLESLVKRFDCMEKIIRGMERTLSVTALERSEQNGEIRTSVAVTQALVAEMKEDIAAIFDRLERRHVDVYPTPHGERREP